MTEMAEHDLILLERDGPVMVLTLNRPAQLNAFDKPLHAALAGALSRIEADPPRVLVITGAGRGFCAGQDLSERVGQVQAGEVIDLGAGIEQKYNPMIRRLTALGCVTIAAVNGVAAGAGLGLALAADIVIAASSARFIMAYGKIGLAPDAGVSWLLPQLIGHKRALALLLAGATVSAQDAKDWGMVWDVVADEELPEQVATLARRLCAGSPDAQRAAKRLIRQPAPDFDRQLDRERDEQHVLGQTAFYRDALLAFSAKS